MGSKKKSKTSAGFCADVSRGASASATLKHPRMQVFVASVPASANASAGLPAHSRTSLAEAYLIWYTLYAPILLRGRFEHERYYKHLTKLIAIIDRLLKFKSTKAERDKLRADIIVWYKQYEK